MFVILVIWKWRLIHYLLYKTPNKKHVCMYVCMYVCYAMLCFSIFIPTSSISYAPITMLPTHSLSGHSSRHVRNSVTTICFNNNNGLLTDPQIFSSYSYLGQPVLLGHISIYCWEQIKLLLLSWSGSSCFSTSG